MSLSFTIKAGVCAGAATGAEAIQACLDQVAARNPDSLAQARAELGETADPAAVLCRAVSLGCGLEIADVRPLLPDLDSADFGGDCGT